MNAGQGQGRIAAFFDVDHTLLDVNSGRSWLRHAWRTGKVRPMRALQAVGWLIRYRLALLDLESVSARVALDYKGVRVADIDAEVREWFYRDIVQHVCVEGREHVADHLQRGHVVTLLTSGTRFSATPLAEMLNVPHVLCTDIETIDGVITGRGMAVGLGMGMGRDAVGGNTPGAISTVSRRVWAVTAAFSAMPTWSCTALRRQ